MKLALAWPGGGARSALGGRPALAAATLCLLLGICGAGAQAPAGQTAGKPGAPPALIQIPVAELDAVPGPRDRDRPASAERAEPPLPAEAASRHSLALPGRTLSFTAKAGAMAFTDAQRATVAEIGYFAYLRDGGEPGKRPVTFAVNGGPGAASAWLHLGALGPWRVSITQAAAHPTAPADLMPNADTWLDFTDLVFIDPVGTGYSRLHNQDKAARSKFWSVDGDIKAIVVFIERWLQANGRLDSPKVLVGESYGGFRAPRIAQALQSMPGLALSGIVLVSPALAAVNRDLPGLGTALTQATSFPSLAAVIADAKGPVSAEQLAAFEREAVGGYLPDMLAGPRDAAAVERLAARIAAITGLDIEAVRRLGPRASARTFLEAIDRGSGRTSSAYDATEKRIAAYDGPDLVDGGDDLTGLSLRLTRGMTALADGRLGWKQQRDYRATSREVRWRWSDQESVTALRSALVHDPALRVLVVHGYADLVTPYLRTKLILDQLPTIGAGNSRVRLEVYGGGHMFYSRDASRARLRSDAMALLGEIMAGR